MGLIVAAVGTIGAGWVWTATTRAQLTANRTKFEFLIVESYDAQYLGDSPGHIGKAGGLGHTAPNIALEDPVYHDKVRIGKVAHLTWDEAKESLEVEFDPEPNRRISIGDSVWIPLGGPSAAKR
jgi:hypothetical protein